MPPRSPLGVWGGFTSAAVVLDLVSKNSLSEEPGRTYINMKNSRPLPSGSTTTSCFPAHTCGLCRMPSAAARRCQVAGTVRTCERRATTYMFRRMLTAQTVHTRHTRPGSQPFCTDPRLYRAIKLSIDLENEREHHTRFVLKWSVASSMFQPWIHRRRWRSWNCAVKNPAWYQAIIKLLISVS